MIETKQDIKRMIVDTLMLQVTPEELGDDLLLFGSGGLGLDSVDALQLVVALDKEFGLKIRTPRPRGKSFEVRPPSPPPSPRRAKNRAATARPSFALVHKWLVVT